MSMGVRLRTRRWLRLRGAGKHRVREAPGKPGTEGSGAEEPRITARRNQVVVVADLGHPEAAVAGDPKHLHIGTAARAVAAACQLEVADEVAHAWWTEHLS